MNLKSLMSKPWIRVVVFLWLLVFPLVFIALPALEIAMGEQEQSWTPVWALIVWMLGPWAGSILLKWFGGESANEQDNLSKD